MELRDKIAEVVRDGFAQSCIKNVSDYETADAILEVIKGAVNPDAVNALASYQQADEEGIMVIVSRQAIEECLPALRILAALGVGK